jgi:hypothetical protein
MANTTITALTAVTNAALTDVFPVDQAGTTYKESLQKVLQLFGTGLTTLYVNPNVGSNTTGNGSAINPYASIAFANSVITDNSATKPYCILLQGDTTEVGLTLKPFVSIAGCDVFSSSIASAGSITLAPTWVSTTGPRASITNINVLAGLNFDSHLMLSSSGINITDCILNGNCAFLGDPIFSGITITDCSVAGSVTATDISIFSALTSFTGGCSFITTDATVSKIWTSQADTFSTFPIAISETSGEITKFVTNATSINTSVTVTGANSSFVFDPVSYPRDGFTFVSGGSATTFLSCPNSVPTTAVTAATYTALKSDYLLSCNRAGTITITLPATVSKNTWVIKDSSGAAATNNITIDGNGNNVDGSSTYVLNTNYGSVTINGDTTNSKWLIT